MKTALRTLTVLTLWAASSCQAITVTGRVVSVADGDTVTVLDAEKVQHKIRLAGIDAPEKRHPSEIGQSRA